METKQTAVEWLEKILDEYRGPYSELAMERAKDIERVQLEAAFKAGWMRANATNYDPSYFEHFLSETYDNH